MLFGNGHLGALDWVFSVQTERTVAQDNTIVIQNRYLQLDKTRFRNTLSGCTVTICERLDGRIWVRWGRDLLTAVKAERDGGKHATSGALDISPKSRDFHFAHRPTTTPRTLKRKAKTTST